MLVSGCTINVGTSQSNDAPAPAVNSTEVAANEAATTVPPADPEAAWDAIAAEVNSLTQSEIAYTTDRLFGLLATPELRLYSFDGDKWVEDATTDLAMLDPLEVDGMEAGSVDYDVTIQNVDLTGDGSVEFIIRFRPAPWDLINAPNQGRNFGSVLSCDAGNCQPLPFWEPPSFGTNGEHYTVEYIEYIDGTLFAQWYGSCGRPCGLLIYEWVEAFERLEGKETTEAQKQETQRLNCIKYRFNYDLPLVLCDEGQPVEMVQSELLDAGFDIDFDGYFGIDTRLAVKFYQKSKGLRASGEVDKATWSEMFFGSILPGDDLNGDGVITPNELSGT